MPDKKEYHVFVELTDLQKKLYEDVLEGKDGAPTNEPLLFIVHTRKLLTHPKMFQCSSTNGMILNLSDSHKTEFAMNVVLRARNNKEKVIITSYFTETLALMQSFL